MERRDPLVTIGMPVYNQGRFLRGALDSLLSQTYRNFELIVSDNASTDETAAIVGDYAKRDPRIRYVRQERNLGPIENYTFVLKAARGEYFMWAAGDDCWEKRFIEKCVRTFDEDPRTIMVFSGFARFDDERKERQSYNPLCYLPLEKGLYQRLKRHLLLSWSEGKGVPLYGLWKRSEISPDLFPNQWGQDTWGFDVYFIFRNLTRGTFGVVNEVLFLKRARLVEHTERQGTLTKFFRTFRYRIQRVSLPFFWVTMGYVIRLEELTALEKVRLTLWNLWAMLRLFVRRTM